MGSTVSLMHSLSFMSVLDRQLGTPEAESQLPGPTAFAFQFLDFGLLECPTRIKTIAVVIDSPLTSAVAGQATAQLFAARSIFSVAGTPARADPAGGGPTMASSPFAGGSGATSQMPATGLNATQARGAAANLGPSTASLGPAGAIFFLSPVDIPELQWYYPVIGIEIKAAVAFTAGAARVFCEFAAT